MNGGKFYRIVLITVIVCQSLVFSCNNRRNPNLSEKQLRALMNDSAQNATEIPFTFLSDTNYIPPAGAKFKEIRSIDPSAPPALIDIARNLENKKEFKLSDIASSVRYIHLQQPPDIKFSSIYDLVTDDEHIFINTLDGLFCYSVEGRYLYTVCKNQVVNEGNFGRHLVMGSMWGKIDLLNGMLVSRFIHWPLDGGDTDTHLNFFDVREMDAQMLFNYPSDELRNTGVKPKYHRRLDPQKTGSRTQYLLMDNQSLFINNSLTSITLYGDTLCKFNNYDLPTLAPEARRVAFFSDIYRINGQMMLRKDNSDTVFRVLPPNRLIPAYVMQWGEYKQDINQHAAGSALEGKLVFSDWVETPRFIFIEYTEGRNYPARRNQVQYYWAIYDKTAKTLTHLNAPPKPALLEVVGGAGMKLNMIENDIDPVGMPFWPKGVNHKNEMYMIFSKERIKRLIETGRYSNDKLQAIYDNMPDGGFGIMIVK